MRKIPRKLSRLIPRAIIRGGGGASVLDIGENVTLVGESPLMLPNVVGSSLKSLYLTGGEITQNGTPTPDAPKPILIGGKELKIMGKNLIDFNAWVGSLDSAIVHGSASFGNGTITISADAEDCFTESEFRVSVKPSTTYTFSWVADNNKDGRQYAFLNGLTTTGNAFFVHNNTAKSLTFTTTADTTFITFRFGVQHSGDSITYSNIQLEEGASVTAYEAYINEPHIDGQELVVSGKNIANPNDFSLLNSAVGTIQDGVFTSKQVDTRASLRLAVHLRTTKTTISRVVSVQDGALVGKYSFSFTPTEEEKYIYIKHDGATRDIGFFVGIDIRTNVTLSFNVIGDAISAVGGLVIGNIQIELGSTATAYEPYKEPQRIPIPLLIGTDTAEVTKGEVVRKWGVVDFDSVRLIYYGEVSQGLLVRLASDDFVGLDHPDDAPVCNIYKGVKHSNLRTDKSIYDTSVNGQRCIDIMDSSLSGMGVQQIISYLKDNCVIVHKKNADTLETIHQTTAPLIKPTSVLTSYVSEISATYRAKRASSGLLEAINDGEHTSETDNQK